MSLRYGVVIVGSTDLVIRPNVSSIPVLTSDAAGIVGAALRLIRRHRSWILATRVAPRATTLVGIGAPRWSRLLIDVIRRRPDLEKALWLPVGSDIDRVLLGLSDR